MEARIASTLVVIVAALSSMGAGYRTENFIVDCSDDAFAKQVAVAAEQFRKELAIEWLGQELPPWQAKCPIRVEFAQFASGETSFRFMPTRGGRGEPFDWNMVVSGSKERILDAVLPHEITHTIFATRFGQPLPRWADEGACTSVEHESERQKHRKMLIDFLTNRRGIPFNTMFRMMQYPNDHVGMLALYSQGHSVADFLIQHQGRQHFVHFIDAGLASGNWDAAVQKFYEYDDLSDLQLTWNDWVRYGSRTINSELQQDQMQLFVNLDRDQIKNGRFASTGEAAIVDPNIALASTQADEAISKMNARGQRSITGERVADAGPPRSQSQSSLNANNGSSFASPRQTPGANLGATQSVAASDVAYSGSAMNQSQSQARGISEPASGVVAESWYLAMMRRHEQGSLDSVTYRPNQGFYLTGQVHPLGYDPENPNSPQTRTVPIRQRPTTNDNQPRIISGGFERQLR